MRFKSASLEKVFADSRRDASFAAYGDDDLVFMMLQSDLEVTH
jgi:hypothetical protein